MICTGCGNGWWEDPTEQCDDWNTLSGDGCSSTCTTEFGYTTPWSLFGIGESQSFSICGDGFGVNSTTDTCDSGVNIGCNATCTGPLPGYTCTVATPTSASVCVNTPP